MKNDRITFDIYEKPAIVRFFQNDIMDEYSVLKYDGEDFIRACYIWLLGRDGDQGGIDSYLDLLESGVTKKAIIYIFSKSKEFNNHTQLIRINEYKKDYLAYQWDVNYLLQCPDDITFVMECYNHLLDRKPELNGLLGYLGLLWNGYPREAVIYCIASSEEGVQTKTIKHLEHYHEIYNLYQNNSRKLLYRIKKKIRRKMNLEKRLLQCYTHVAMLSIKLLD